MSDSLANYYYYINQAELMISENNLVGADNKYQQAREFKLNWFGRDYYNFALLKLKLDQPKEVFFVLTALCEKGFNPNLLLEKESFKKHFETRRGKRQLEDLNKVEPTYNVKLRDRYDSLFVVDSLANERYDHDRFIYEVGQIDSSTIAFFMQLIDTYGFPSEELIGINGWFKQDPVFSIMSHHSWHNQIEERVNFSELIKKSAEEGKIKNYAVQDYVKANSSSYSFSTGGEIIKWLLKDTAQSTATHPVYSDSLFAYESYKMTKEVENQHLSIGLPTIEECLQLSKFNWENDTEFFLGTAATNTYVVNSTRVLEMVERTGNTVHLNQTIDKNLSIVNKWFSFFGVDK